MDRASLEVGIGASMQELSVGLHDSFKQDDRMRSGMAVALCAKVGRIANQVMLGARFGVLVEQAQPDRPVIDDRLRLVEFERREIVLQHRARLCHDDRVRSFRRRRPFMIGRSRLLISALLARLRIRLLSR